MKATYQGVKSMKPQRRTAEVMNMKRFNNRGKKLAKNSPAQDMLQEIIDMLRRRVATLLKSGYAQSKETNVFRDVGLRARRAWKTADQLKAGLLTKAMATESEVFWQTYSKHKSQGLVAPKQVEFERIMKEAAQEVKKTLSRDCKPLLDGCNDWSNVRRS